MPVSTTMRGTLDIDRNAVPLATKYKNPRALAAVFVGISMFVGFWYFIHWLEHASKKQPHLVVMFPLAGAGLMVAFLPLVMFLAYQEDFGNLNPIYPTHYMFLVKKTLNALQENNWKISAKDI
mmetsp:Transcript_30676/g.59157  ORF Transcript_30676/g.59157 Transcript_30676/m.59157 type:complete len:123 (-) Transcript_30676:333-701(-)|eukprot:CAMPEP_0114255158 /NCGR_PEP_ID=MMETSP0058-20121206/17398_1 /TAXON_ID=36894 /ORGANISM="Pyramimonas parkeae, CCMP726" /LENGTH=122 /DNA_ID=CAMNT_0001369495 /DNA_START=157 /DNA_END=525 /DNA_ORIENTATION=+